LKKCSPVLKREAISGKNSSNAASMVLKFHKKIP
jgi:hypothetical protein